MENVPFPTSARPRRRLLKTFLRRPESKTMTTDNDDLFGEGKLSPEDPKETELEYKFLATPEAQEWLDFCDKAEEAIATSMSLSSVFVPKAFLIQILTDIKTNPLMFLHLRAARERVAAELGLRPEKEDLHPERKK